MIRRCNNISQKHIWSIEQFVRLSYFIHSEVQIPRKRIRERFLLIYELKGCQKAVDFLTEYYRIRKMKIIVDGRRVMRTKTHKTYLAHYYRNKAYFTKRGLTKRTVLHELYHHLVYVNGLEMIRTTEERATNGYVKDFLF